MLFGHENELVERFSRSLTQLFSQNFAQAVATFLGEIRLEAGTDLAVHLNFFVQVV